jgi:hypothetical protein
MFSVIVASDLCRGVGASLKIPPILGVQRIFFEILLKKDPYQNHTKSMN